MQTKNKTIGERIQYLRKKNTMTQRELAGILYVSDKTVSSWERDRTRPDYMIIIKISELFHTSVNYLLIGENKNTL